MHNEADKTLGVIIVDHGSTRAESNEMLLGVVEIFCRETSYEIVEPAHMELAEPSIATAFGKCVERGARRVVVSPYFLLPGKHWHKDIPRLVEQAAEGYPGISYLVAAPIGLHPLMAQVIGSRIEHCLNHATGKADECEVCEGTGRCGLREGGVVGG